MYFFFLYSTQTRILLRRTTVHRRESGKRRFVRETRRYGNSYSVQRVVSAGTATAAKYIYIFLATMPIEIIIKRKKNLIYKNRQLCFSTTFEEDTTRIYILLLFCGVLHTTILLFIYFVFYSSNPYYIYIIVVGRAGPSPIHRWRGHTTAEVYTHRAVR